ncbi:MAG: hypothetical protein M1838_006210 [Thelocarpon superellum]|nr:MAG: hypothetical protein M1838_006210 [Thelocarpon superellum]
MRYQNWDVILFANESRIPIQEFNTGCHVLQDPESSKLQAVITQNLPFPVDQVIPIPLPTIVSFIPNLPKGFPFRISVHSWDNPRPSPGLESMMTKNDKVLFEARVTIDGRCVASSLFTSKGPWPQIIDWFSTLDKYGHPETLKFPPFWSEILGQSWWSAAESTGRIKVIIAEGFLRERLQPPFERVKNLVTFSFQHAPIETLPVPFKLRSQGASSHESSTQHVSNAPPIWTGPDPFISGHGQSGPEACLERGSHEDQPMPDYSNSATTQSSSRSRSVSGPADIGRAASPAVVAPPDDALYKELLEALSPQETTATLGIFAPANTRASSADSTLAHPPPSAAAQARIASYSSVTRKVPPSAIKIAGRRDRSDISMRSRSSEDAGSHKENVDVKIQRVPASCIKGKKEGNEALDAQGGLAPGQFASSARLGESGTGPGTGPGTAPTNETRAQAIGEDGDGGHDDSYICDVGDGDGGGREYIQVLTNEKGIEG